MMGLDSMVLFNLVRYLMVNTNNGIALSWHKIIS